jgi:Aspartyl protease
MKGLRTGSRKKSRQTGAFALCTLALALYPLAAQQAAPQPPPPQPVAAPQQTPPQQPAPVPPQQPGLSEQVHTGTTSGLDTDARLQNLLADHQFLRIESQLDQLPPEQAQLYRGILANRSNDLKSSIQLLEPLVDQVAASGDKAKEKLVRKALAEDYLRSGDWAKAAKAYQTFDLRLQGHLTPDEQEEIEMPRKLSQLASADPSRPAMTVDPADPFILQAARNPLGLTDIPVYVDARPHSWMLDPTSPFNLISRSLAKEAGLKVSELSTTIRSLTGRPIEIYVTIIPRFTIGGLITFRNMTAFVYNDADYAFPQLHYQVQGVLGYPALSALGSLTITNENMIEVRPAKLPPPADKSSQTQKIDKDDHPAPGASFFLDGERIIVALGNPAADPSAIGKPSPAPPPETKTTPPGDLQSTAPSSPGLKTAIPSDAQTVPAPQPVPKTNDERMFQIDAGGQQTYLTSRYYDEHTAEFTGQKMQLFTLPGLQSATPQPAFVAETIPLAVGPTTVPIHFIQVLTQPLGSAALDDVYGVLGIDALDQLQAYTFDYRTMRFSVKPE